MLGMVVVSDVQETFIITNPDKLRHLGRAPFVTE
jgi:hypothetical protein